MSSEKSIAIVKHDNGEDSSDLPAAAAALSPEDRADLLNALKGKLQSLARKRTDFLKTLTPKVQKRVQVLKNMQVEHDELEAKFLEEKADLEARYEKLYEPLFTKRYEIVSGEVELEQAEDVTMKESDKDKQEKGVPDFWLTAMKSNEIIANEITERDEEALKYLKDIRCRRLDRSRSFRLEFLFDPNNPYFKNLVLTKTYHLMDDDDGDDGHVLEKVTGTEIEWNPGKCLTKKKVVKKKPRKGSKPVTKNENCESFFNLFKPPEIDEDIIDDYYDDAEFDMAEELQNLMEQDYDIAVSIRKKLIPHAVSWFTGEALHEDDDE